MCYRVSVLAVNETKTCRKCNAEKARSEFHRDKNRKDGLYCYCKVCAIRDVKRHTASPEWKAHKKSYDRARIEANRERLSRQWRESYLRNRERQLETAKRWAAKNRDKRRLISQSYKHRRRAVERQGMTWKELRDWKGAQAKVCHWCGKACAKSYVVDHIKPLAKGGAHETHNLAIACRSCNARKSARDPIEFAREMGKLL